jgi:hypothetical protein
MPGFTVETLAITGQWVPKDGVHKLQTLLSAGVETFEARLKGQRSRIRVWPTGEVVAEVPPRSLYVGPRDIYGRFGALRKLGVSA